MAKNIDFNGLCNAIAQIDEAFVENTAKDRRSFRRKHRQGNQQERDRPQLAYRLLHCALRAERQRQGNVWSQNAPKIGGTSEQEISFLQELEALSSILHGIQKFGASGS